MGVAGESLIARSVPLARGDLDDLDGLDGLDGLGDLDDLDGAHAARLDGGPVAWTAPSG